MNYDRGRFGCAIIKSDKYGVGLSNSEKWWDTANLNIFVKKLDEEVKLRIPDKYLKAKGWL